jgi:hypothetical protein
MPGRQPGCPLDLDLERALGGDAAFQPALTHAEGCAACAARLAWMREAGELFTRRVFPATRDRVVEAVLRPPLWARLRRGWAVAIPAAAAALLLVAVVVPLAYPPISPSYVGEKGHSGEVPLRVHVYVDGGGGGGGKPRQLSTGDRVYPGDGIRFVVEAPGREVFLLSVDARGNVSRLVPGGQVRVPETGIVPGGSVLDEVLGPERIYAVESAPGVDLPAVESAIREAIGAGGEDGVREAGALPVRAPQGTLLLEKVAR